MADNSQPERRILRFALAVNEEAEKIVEDKQLQVERILETKREAALEIESQERVQLTEDDISVVTISLRSPSLDLQGRELNLSFRAGQTFTDPPRADGDSTDRVRADKDPIRFPELVMRF